MMMKQGKLRFLSARILCVIIGLIVVIGILSLLLLFDSFKESSVNVVILAFCIGLTLLLCCFFWKMIVKPFNQMEKNLGLFLDGYTTSHLMGEDNIFYISPAYEGVITKIQYMLQSQELLNLNKRQAQYLALQNQINPHFLYNTLDSLYFVAIMHGDDQMAEMVEALSDNFKLALNNGSKYIKVADSVKWMQGYMKLQNMRYNNRFELFVDIRREILQRETITFIFQPFIENAMYHGLEPKIGKGKISLRGWQEQNNMIFTIEDDGVGIDDMSRLENGYGVRNVIERIKLNYGEKYGVTFESSPGNGTKVTIVVPVR